MNSIATPITMQKAMAHNMATKRLSLNTLTIIHPTKAPAMKISPWAKLIRETIPYTMVYPKAIRA